MQFPNTRNFTGPFAPSGVEADIHALPLIAGCVPADLDGSFFRVSPDPQFPPRAGDDIWFNGDGMITKLRFRNGEVSMRQRWVHTEKFKRERAAGKALFGAYRNPLTDDPSVEGVVRSTANTNILCHAGKLLALKEDSPPVAMDPETLETIGEWTFGDRMTSQTFTAHPKIDPDTGEMLAFGYAAKGLCTKDMAYYAISPQGEVTREIWFELPYYCMMHDFGFTPNYALFHVVPIVGSWERLRAGLPHFGFDTTLPVFLGVLPRNGSAADIRWFEGPNCFASHVMNAHEEGSKIHFDVPVAPGNLWPFFPDVDGAPFEPDMAQARMMRWTVDMLGNSNAIGSAPLADFVGEFPRIDDRFAGKKNRYGWQLVQDGTKPVEGSSARSASGFLMNTLGLIDLETGETTSWWAGPTSSLQEPAFIPRPGSSEEGDGYIILVENRLAEMSSRILLFDALCIADGPVATLASPLRLRPALHGNWADGV